MNKIQEALQWIESHIADKRDFTPQPPTHPVPSYVAEAEIKIENRSICLLTNENNLL